MVTVGTTYFCFSAHSPLIAIHSGQLHPQTWNYHSVLCALIIILESSWRYKPRFTCTAVPSIYIDWFWKRKTTSKLQPWQQCLGFRAPPRCVPGTQVGGDPTGLFLRCWREVSRAAQVRSADMSELIPCASTRRRAAVGVQSESAGARWATNLTAHTPRV